MIADHWWISALPIRNRQFQRGSFAEPACRVCSSPFSPLHDGIQLLVIIIDIFRVSNIMWSLHPIKSVSSVLSILFC